MLKSLSIVTIEVLLNCTGAAFADECGAACHAQYLAQMKACAVKIDRSCQNASYEESQCQRACPTPPARSGTVR
jgi:hypothetical protein